MADIKNALNGVAAAAKAALDRAIISFAGTGDVVTPYRIVETDVSGRLKVGTIRFPGSETIGGSGFLDANMKPNGTPSIGLAANMFVDHVHPATLVINPVSQTGSLTYDSINLIYGANVAVELSLPTAIIGKQIIVKCVTKGAGAITIKPGANVQIDSLSAGTSVPVSSVNQSFTLIATDALNWFII